jgi:hypothetical protein
MEEKSKSSNQSRRPWDDDWYVPSSDYAAMRSLFFSCWACNASRRPLTYYGPWCLERAHIANKPRREDRRLVVMLCSICHKVSHGERLAGFVRPRLEVAHLLALKQEIDPDWFDLPFIQRHSVRILPEPERIPEEYFSLRVESKRGY